MEHVSRCCRPMDVIAYLRRSAGGTNNVKDGDSLGETTSNTT